MNKVGQQMLSFGRAMIKYWEASRWVRVVMFFVLASLAVLVAFGRLPDERKDMWSVQMLDRAVFITLAIAFLLVFFSGLSRLWSSPKISGPDLRRGVLRGGGAILLVLTLYATYGAFRNQSRLTSETGLTAEAMQIYQLEMDNEELRCLYDNYGHSRPAQCLDRLASSERLWSLAILYVEEVWSILIRAELDEREWGSTYSDAVDFWRQDVALDPTGLFAYYLVATEGVEGAAREMRRAGVRIPNPCANYRRVREALIRHGGGPDEQDPCPPT